MNSRELVGKMNALTSEMRRLHPPPIITPEEEEKREQDTLALLKEAEWMCGPSTTGTMVICGICRKQSPMRKRTPYPFRTEAGGSFSAYIGSEDSIGINLCPECCAAAWTFLLKRKENESL